MQALKRNKVYFFYALYEGKKPILDEYGNKSGEYEIAYSKPTPCFANISAAKGETQTRQFGETEDYDKIIVLVQKSSQIDTHSVLWIDTQPKLDSDGNLEKNTKGEVITPYDYVVKKIAKSLNSISIAVSKVNVSQR
ncbi:MAG: hypothetical protein KH972_02595 [Peptostreptococcaceae bacterium]|nr:hypothetical protein [Peptostreptococcaceae bacterium]